MTTDAELERWLEEEFVKRGATGYTVVPCTGVGRRQLVGMEPPTTAQVRIEVIVTNDVCERILEFLRREIGVEHHITACVEVVEVLRVGPFKMEDVPQVDGNAHDTWRSKQSVS